MVLAAQKGPASSPRLADFYDRTMLRSGKKTARVALARKMLTIVYYMLVRNQPFQERQRDD